MGKLVVDAGNGWPVDQLLAQADGTRGKPNGERQRVREDAGLVITGHEVDDAGDIHGGIAHLQFPREGRRVAELLHRHLEDGVVPLLHMVAGLGGIAPEQHMVQRVEGDLRGHRAHVAVVVLRVHIPAILNGGHEVQTPPSVTQVVGYDGPGDRVVADGIPSGAAFRSEREPIEGMVVLGRHHLEIHRVGEDAPAVITAHVVQPPGDGQCGVTETDPLGEEGMSLELLHLHVEHLVMALDLLGAGLGRRTDQFHVSKRVKSERGGYGPHVAGELLGIDVPTIVDISSEDQVPLAIPMVEHADGPGHGFQGPLAHAGQLGMGDRGQDQEWEQERTTHGTLVQSAGTATRNGTVVGGRHISSLQTMNSTTPATVNAPPPSWSTGIRKTTSPEW